MDKILVVDHMVQSTDLISQCLSNTNFQIYTSESGLNALAKVNLFKPDVVILNTDLPDISGYDVCKRMKSDLEDQYIMVLIVSAIDTRESRMRAIEAGADDYIEKNFDAHMLISKVNSLLRVKHLGDVLKQKYLEIEEKNHIIDYQLKMARQVQRSLIPDIDLLFRDIRFKSRYIPALDIGGDFYDVVPLSPTSISIVVGDVSGHGISAAMLTAMLRMMVRNLMLKYYNPDQLLFYLNKEMCGIFENSLQEMYSCIFYAVIDTKEKSIYYSNAGQTYPIYVDAESNTVFELDASGLPVGMMNDSKYQFKTLKYKPGDTIAFYTDGLTDVFYKNSPEEFLGRIKDILLDVHTMDKLEDMIEIIFNAFYNYNASEAVKLEMDDVSLVLCKM